MQPGLAGQRVLRNQSVILRFSGRGEGVDETGCGDK